MKLNRLILAAFAALAVFACNKPEPEKEPEPKDTTPAELKSFALLKADNADILTEDVTVETIAPTMVVRIPGGGAGKTLVAAVTAGENDVIKANGKEAVDGKITFEGQEYDYLFWEGVPKFEYDFYTGYCVKGEDTESFLKEKLAQQGLNDAEIAEFLKFWLSDMEGNPYNVISFQGKTYTRGAKLTVTPEPDNLIRVFMAWYPSEHHIRIKPQILDTPSRDGFTVVEWGGNKVK
jgi:hypothetical protein